MLPSVAVAALCLLFLAGIVFFASKTRRESSLVATSTVPQDTAHFDALSLEAKAVEVYDVKSKTTLYAKNNSLPLPLASITKLLTALVVMSALPPDTVVVITDAAIRTDGDSGLTSGERWDLADLVSFMLMTSSNDAATALKSAYETETGGSFIAAMNAYAEDLGLTQSTFTNETGLDISGYPSNAGSAHDAALLLAAALSVMPEALDVTRYESHVFTSQSGTVHRANNTNMIVDAIPWSVGAKTGFTDTAGGNLVISFDVTLGRPIVIAVLGSSREGRFADMQRLVDATIARMQTL